MLERHEIPTHLEVVDKLVFGLSARQVLIVGLGLTLGYTIWQRLGARVPPHVLAHASFASTIPWPLRLSLAALPVMVAAGVAFARWRDRTLEAWGMAGLRYGLLAKCAAWRPIARVLSLQGEQELRTLAGHDGHDDAENAPSADAPPRHVTTGGWADHTVPNWGTAASLVAHGYRMDLTRRVNGVNSVGPAQMLPPAAQDPLDVRIALPPAAMGVAFTSTGAARTALPALPPSPALATLNDLVARHRAATLWHSARSGPV